MNIFSNIPECEPHQEAFQTLASFTHTSISLIRSRCFENGSWYDQSQHEWVLLLQGSATLEFETHSVILNAGDALQIAAHEKHRVTRTSENALWLAVYIDA